MSVQLNNPITHHDCSGQTVELTFDPKHQEQLEDAARRVFWVPVPPGGGVRGSTLGARVYSRKKAQSKSQLKSKSVHNTAVGSELPLPDTLGVTPSSRGSSTSFPLPVPYLCDP